MKRTAGLRLLVVSALAGQAALALAASATHRRPKSSKPAAATHHVAAQRPSTAPPADPAPASVPAGAEVTELHLTFDVAVARPGAQVVVTARLLDAHGAPRDAPLRLEADPGVVGPPVRVSPGVYTARLTLPTVLAGRRSTLVFGAAGQAATSLGLPLASGPAAVLSVEAPADLPADGATHPLWIGVADAHGNPADEPPQVTVTRGELGEPVAIGAGEWMVDYRPPRTSWVGDEVVRATAGGAMRVQPLSLMPVPAVLTLAPRAGVVLGMGASAAAFGGDATVWSAASAPDLGLVLAASWWATRDSADVALPAGTAALRTRRSWLPVTLSAAVRQRLGARGALTLTAGGGGALVTSKAALSGQAEVSESGWAPAATVGLELSYRTRLGAPFAEVRGGWIGSPHLDTVRGNAWPVMLSLGARFDAY